MGLRERIAAARGQIPADLVVRGGRIVNVFTRQVYAADVAIHEGVVVGLGSYAGREAIDARDSFLIPGLIDGHLHLESTLLSLGEFAGVVVPHGTTAVVLDPHELGNVLGVAGIRGLLEAAPGLPLDVLFALPSCVPASPLESAGARLEAHDLAPLFQERRVVALGEVMNFPGVLAGLPDVLDKIEVARLAGRAVDGHAPGLLGADLQAYATAGAASDHESTTAAEAEARLRAGLWLMVREGSVARNLDELLPVVQRLGSGRALLVTDDITPGDLVELGHLDHVIRRAVGGGLDPIDAIAMATVNPAQRFNLTGLGAIAPGYQADLVVVDDLQQVRPRLVLKAGRVVARDGVPSFEVPSAGYQWARGTFRVGDLSPERLRIPGRPGRHRVIEIIPDQIVTRQLWEEAATRDGEIVADPGRDLVKLAVIERHRGTGRVGLGMARGLGLRAGAIASSIGHDAHNLVVAGVDDADMLAAARRVVDLDGGLVVVRDGREVANLPLEVAGLMSLLPAPAVADGLRRVERAAAELGARPAHPFMALSFLTLSVIPELKLTDQGLVDVGQFAIVPIQS